MKEKFSRTEMLVGADSIKKLSTSRVAVLVSVESAVMLQKRLPGQESVQLTL
jgi:hypothetical protein